MKHLENLLLFLTAAASIIVAGLDILGLLDSNSWIIQRIPVLTLLCVGFIASYLILERKGEISAIADAIHDNNQILSHLITQSASDTIRALEGVEVQVFNTRNEFFAAITPKIRVAHRVDDLVWNVTSGSKEPVSAQEITYMDRYSDTIEKALRKQDMVWREVVLFTRDRFERTEQRVLNRELKGFNVGYLDPPPPEHIPRIGFMIIDNSEVFLFNLPNSANQRVYIKHPDIVQYFSLYYEALWDVSHKLKRGNKIDHVMLEELRKKWLV